MHLTNGLVTVTVLFFSNKQLIVLVILRLDTQLTPKLRFFFQTGPIISLFHNIGAGKLFCSMKM